MISFELTEEQYVAQSMFAAIAAQSVAPRAAQHDLDSAVSTDVLQLVHEQGLLLAALEDRAADSQVGLQSCLLLEELGKADTSVAVLVGAALGYIGAVSTLGDADQREAMVARYSGGRLRGGSILVQEPGFVRNLRSITTRAERSNEGFLLNGAKAFVPQAEGWDDLLVVARTDDRFGAFLVDRNTAGVDAIPTAPMLGLRGLSMTTLTFTDVVLPASARLPGAVDRVISGARIANGAILTGLAAAVFEHITPYTKERVVHGSALARKQSVAFRLAQMAIHIPSMRWLTWRGAVAIDKERDAGREATYVRRFCGRNAFAIADEGVQLMGGHGYMKENPVERWYRDARTLALLEGVTGI